MLRTKLQVAALLIFGLLVGLVPAWGFDRDDRKCEQRIHKAQENLEKAERKHGEHSRQAEERRHQLEEIRERCHHDRDDHDRH